MLGLKADALEILIALDNGDVEIYDRYSLNLTHTVVGKFLIKMCIKSYSSYVSVLTIVGFFIRKAICVTGGLGRQFGPDIGRIPFHQHQGCVDLKCQATGQNKKKLRYRFHFLKLYFSAF